MRKKPIQFPIFTARENSKQKNFKTEEKPMKQKIKSKNSFNLLKLINEDINRVRKSERQNLAHLQKINCKKNNKISTIEGKAKEFSVPNKKIHSISGFQAKSNRKFEPNASKTNRQKVGQPIKNRKKIIGSIQERQSIANVKLSSQKVIVARNRKQFTKIDEQLLYDRRQNYLNSKFNDRVNRLNNITQQNRKIYERINSQRSHYSNTDLNKSYESNSRISQRLSMSKLSKRSRLSMSSQKSNANSRCSIASKASSKYSYKNCGNLKSKQGLRNKQNSKNNLIKIQSKNINDIKADQLQNFATLFLQKPSHELKIKPGLGKRSKSVYSKQNDQNVVAPSAQRISVKSSGKTAKAKGLLPSLIEISEKNQLVKPKTSVLRKTILTAIDQNAIRLTVNCLQKIVEQSPVTARFSNFRIQNRRM